MKNKKTVSMIILAVILAAIIVIVVMMFLPKTGDAVSSVLGVSKTKATDITLDAEQCNTSTYCDGLIIEDCGNGKCCCGQTAGCCSRLYDVSTPDFR